MSLRLELRQKPEVKIAEKPGVETAEKVFVKPEKQSEIPLVKPVDTKPIIEKVNHIIHIQLQHKLLLKSLLKLNHQNHSPQNPHNLIPLQKFSPEQQLVKKVFTSSANKRETQTNQSIY